MIAILKYNAGNIKSVENAINKLGFNAKVTNDKDEILNSEKLIIPGVGEASSAMKYLKENNLDNFIKELKIPVLGICLGLQIMCKFSEEGNTNCLNIFDSIVKKFPADLIVPHVGWNSLNTLKGELFENLSELDNFYFVHSYYAEISNNAIGICDYILPFSAALNKANFWATQFHPEKSSDAGSRVLNNFLKMSN
jgi:glutamine amidotransferase